MNNPKLSRSKILNIPKKHLGRGSHCSESQEKFSCWQALDILEATLWEAYTQAVQLGVKVGSGFDRLNRTHTWWGIKEAAKSMVYGEI